MTEQSIRRRCVGVALSLLFCSIELNAQIGSNEHFFAQIAVNDGSETSFSIHNPSSTDSIDVDIELYSPNGSLLTMSSVFVEAGAAASASFGEDDEPLTAGWAKLSSDRPFTVTEFLQLQVGEARPPQVGVLPSLPGREARFFGFVNQARRTGLAVSNPSDSEGVDVTIQVIDGNGTVAAETVRSLEARQQIAVFLEDLFDLADLGETQVTAIVRSANTPVAVLTLLQDSANNLVTVPVFNRFILPQVALRDEFEGEALDNTVWDVFGGSPSVAGGRLELQGDAENRADIQSLRTMFLYGVLQAEIRSADWAAQDQGAESDSSFGFELFTGANGACHYAVLLCSDGHLAVLRPEPDENNNCAGDPQRQAFLAVSNWDALRASERLHVTLTWAPGGVALFITDGAEDGPTTGFAAYAGPAEPNIALGVRLNADFNESYSLDFVRAGSIQPQ